MLNSTQPISRRKAPAIALALALIAALIGIISYSSSGTASADEPSCTINECESGAAAPDEQTLRDALRTRENGAYFWTGRVDGTSVEEDALRLARADNGTTLEGALADADITMPEFADRTPEAIAAWELASRIFAEQASGDVFVVMGTEIREGNVFETLEFPALRANQNVRRVIQVEPENGGEVKVLFDRDNPDNGGEDGGDPGNGEGDGNNGGEPDEDSPEEDDPNQDPDGEGDDTSDFSIIAEKDNDKCVDSSEGENGARLTVRACNGTARQDFELDEGKLVAGFDRSRCLFVFPPRAGEFIAEVTLSDCDNAPTWQFNNDGTWFSNRTRGCLSVADNRLEEAAEVFTQPCDGALRWSNVQ